MFGEQLMRDFLGMPGGLEPDPRHSYTQVTGIYDQETVLQASALAKGQPPEVNMVPYLELVSTAKRLGLKVVRE